MKKNFVAVKEKILPDLLIPPHIVDTLVDILTGELKLDTSEQEKIIAHLTKCSDCRTALNVLLAVTEQDEQASEDVASIRKMLTQFVTIHDRIEAQEYEQMAVYAETIVTKDQEVADEQFPVLAEQIKRSPKLNSILENILASLREDEETC